jgi:hypothetical protein
MAPETIRRNPMHYFGKWVVETTYLESKTFSADGLEHWGLKGGQDYLVTGIEREEDALAWVLLNPLYENQVICRASVTSHAAFLERIHQDHPADYAEFLANHLLEVGPYSDRPVDFCRVGVESGEETFLRLLPR